MKANSLHRRPRGHGPVSCRPREPSQPPAGHTSGSSAHRPFLGYLSRLGPTPSRPTTSREVLKRPFARDLARGRRPQRRHDKPHPTFELTRAAWQWPVARFATNDVHANDVHASHPPSSLQPHQLRGSSSFQSGIDQRASQVDQRSRQARPWTSCGFGVCACSAAAATSSAELANRKNPKTRQRLARHQQIAHPSVDL